MPALPFNKSLTSFVASVSAVKCAKNLIVRFN